MLDKNSVLLEFNPELNRLRQGKELRHGLSGVVQIGTTLWVANDETLSLERLSYQKEHIDDAYKYNEHQQFALSDYLSLPVPPPSDLAEKVEEADIEGLDYKDGYLWLVGSHSLKRSNPKPDKDSREESFKRLAKVSADGNRYLLARIPVVKKDGSYTLEKETDQNGNQRTAAQLRGLAKGNLLTEALAQDKHLQRFFAIPGKDNGFDIEGLAVAGGDRLFLGLRGPVLRGWATLLELELQLGRDNPHELILKDINPNNPFNPDYYGYRKHFLELNGLGIRDLCVDGSDLLILAGPTMDLDGPVSVFRWRGGAQPPEESLVSRDKLQKILEIPYAQGKDHAEGMALFSADDSDTRSLLVVYDSASEDRQTGISAVKGDIFTLPE
jgi:hypothetical protein